MHHLGKDHGIEGSNFAGLQHHRAACGDGRRNLGDNLIERPIPGCNQSSNTDGLAYQARAALMMLEFKSV
jgi:hypothetical protein